MLGLPQAVPPGYTEVLELMAARDSGWVRPFSWDEWQALPAVFTRRLKIATEVVAEVRKYRASG